LFCYALSWLCIGENGRGKVGGISVYIDGSQIDENTVLCQMKRDVLICRQTIFFKISKPVTLIWHLEVMKYH
jgi:hypothetical protein